MTFNTFLCILLGAFFLAATVTTSSALKISNRESTLLRHTQHLTLGRLRRHYIAIKSQLTDDQALLHVKTIVEENPDATEAEIVAFLRLCGMSMSRIHNIHAKLKEAEKFYLAGLKIKPDHNGINEYLGELYVKTGRLELARERLAILKNCNCEEYTELKEVIENK